MTVNSVRPKRPAFLNFYARREPRDTCDARELKLMEVLSTSELVLHSNF